MALRDCPAVLNAAVARHKRCQSENSSRRTEIADPIPRVSVIIPAFNAAATISETLKSACAQTHRELEIVVVDDGSTDATAAIVRAYASLDPRIRLIEQDNAGVAAARNAGAAAATGDFLAPLDADDLWEPSKIERQLEVFERKGPQTGLVYTWFALIDARSRVFHQKHRPEYEGQVLEALAHYNFVGTGSSVLIRRSVFEESPGYDPTLRLRGGEGCEDWKLYFQIAERHDFGVVRLPLTGYRMLPNNMSSDLLQMLRSRDLATADLLRFHPELAHAFRAGRNRLSRFLLHRALRRGPRRDIAALLKAIGTYDPLFLVGLVATLPLTAYRTIRDHIFRSAADRKAATASFGALDWLEAGESSLSQPKYEVGLTAAQPAAADKS